MIAVENKTLQFRLNENVEVGDWMVNWTSADPTVVQVAQAVAGLHVAKLQATLSIGGKGPIPLADYEPYARAFAESFLEGNHGHKYAQIKARRVD